MASKSGAGQFSRVGSNTQEKGGVGCFRLCGKWETGEGVAGMKGGVTLGKGQGGVANRSPVSTEGVWALESASPGVCT